MNIVQSISYQGQAIQQRDDGCFNLTQMAQANGKLLGDYLRLKSTQSYMEALSSDMGIPISDLVDVVKGGQSAMQGTWGHKLVAVNLARWISPKFAVWSDAHIFTLMEKGQTSLAVDPLAEMRLKVELAKQEAIKCTAEQKTIELRHYAATVLPKPIGDRVLGVITVTETKYRDRVIQDELIIRDGTTITKTELCHRYGILTRNGKPHYSKLNLLLETIDLPSEAWQMTASLRENYEFKEEYLDALDKLIDDGDRQMFLGE